MKFWVEDIREPVEMRVDGYTSTASAHRHIFKHIVPLYEFFKPEHDECWEEIIPSPPLEPEYKRRVRHFLKKLSEIPSCKMVQSRSVEAGCLECRDREAQQGVDELVRDVVREVCKAAQDTVEWAFANRTSSGQPRAYVAVEEWGHLLYAMDARMVQVVALVQKNQLRLVTCFRRKAVYKKRNYEQLWLDMCREAAAARRLGTYRSIEKISEGV